MSNVHGPRRPPLGDGDDDLAGGEHLHAQARGLGTEDQARAPGQRRPLQGDGPLDIVNVEDRYRYWTMDAIRADIAARSLPFEVAVENLDHDFNIGSIVRTANAMGARRVHVVGRKRWNRRGAMVTDRYLPVDHRPEVGELVDHCAREGLTLVGVDNVEGSIALEGAVLPERACLVFGSEASGLSEEMLAACEIVVAITQRGSTRSMNVGHAAAIVMWAHASRLEAAEK